jgi:hypothetical protein
MKVIIALAISLAAVPSNGRIRLGSARVTKLLDVPADHIAKPSPGKGQIIFFRGASKSNCLIEERGSDLIRLKRNTFWVLDSDAGLRAFDIPYDDDGPVRINVEAGVRAYVECAGDGTVRNGRKLSESSRDGFFDQSLRFKPIKP